MVNSPLKIFILDNHKDTENLEDTLNLVSEESQIPVDIKKDNGRTLRKLPNGYDIYFLHLSQIELQEVSELRKKQSKSYFVGVSIMGVDISPEDISKVFDETVNLFHSKYQIQRILDNTWMRCSPKQPKS